MVAVSGGVALVVLSSGRVYALTWSCCSRRRRCGGRRGGRHAGGRGRSYNDIKEICLSLRVRNDSGNEGGIA